MNPPSLGDLIRSLRTQNHWTQANLAEKLHVTDKAVSKWERNLSCPDISLLPKLAELFHVTVEDLLKTFTVDRQASQLSQILEISHDLRTPIHIILGCADMVETYHDQPEQRKRYLDSIRVSAEYLLHAIDRDSLPTSQASPPAPQPSRTMDTELDTYLRTHIEQKQQNRKPENHTYDFTGKHILLAEDIELNREIAQEMLRYTGVTVEFAEDGQRCIDLLNAAPEGYYDLILMDIMMPGMDGIEATRRIRRLPDPVKSRIPIIAMSANVQKKDKKAALDAGMNAFAEKPVHPGHLLSILDHYL